MGFSEYDNYDALGLAELVKGGEVSARELCEEAIARAERHEPTLNAINYPMFERAIAAAEAGEYGDGAFAGVPFLIKDLALHVAGVPLSNGSEALRDYVPTYDDTLVQRFRKAGLIIFGKSNTPELALMGVTEPKAFGPTRNPWNPEHTAGGSSGGASAAVAAGYTPIASASDGGGSIRIPAAMTGLFGLKPSRGRLPQGPSRAEGWDGASVPHVLTRSVRDSAAMLDATHGPDPGAPYAIERPRRAFLKELERRPRGLRIAFCTRSPIGTDVDYDCAEAVRKTARLLESLGHTVEAAEPEVDGHAVAKAYLTMYFGQVSADLRWIRSIRGEAGVAKTELTTRLLGLIGDSLSSGEYVESKRGWNDFARAMARFHERYDLYLTPTIAHPPARIGELAPTPPEQILSRGLIALNTARPLVAMGIVDKMATRNLRRTPFTQLANLTGQPAMSVPMHWTKAGLPIGVQFIAPFGDEATLLRLAAQLEEAQPWFDRRPPLVG